MPEMQPSEILDIVNKIENITEDLIIENERNDWAPSPDLPSWVSFMIFQSEQS